ncbi:GLUG [Candidatus Nanopelagicaceae bacterium]
MPKVFLRSIVLITLFSFFSTQNAMSSGPISLNQESFLAQIGGSLDSIDGYELEVDIFVPDEASTAGYPLFTSLTTSLNGNGFTVRNLKGPMFQGISGGEVVDLTLETHNDGALGNGILATEVTNSIIENVTLRGSLVSLANNTGGLAGHIQDSTVEQVNSTVNISGSHNGIGGIVGSSENSTISLVKVEATISGSNNVGGIAGVVDSTTISSSQFKGSVEADSNNAGGIAGAINDGTQINSSYSDGSVEGNSQIGGLVGSSTGAASNLVVGSYSTGLVSGNYDVGGLIGKADQISIENSFSRAEISGVGTYTSEKLGGLAGSASGFSVNNSYASGTIESRVSATFSGYTGDPYLTNTRIGGLIGEALSGVISNSFADSTLNVEINAEGSGLVNSVSLLNLYIGGILGYAQNVKVADTFSSSRLNSSATLSLSGDVTNSASVANSNIGGLIGYLNCTVDCDVTTIENIGTTGSMALEANSQLNGVSGSYNVSNEHAGTLVGQASNVVIVAATSTAVLTEARTRLFENSTSGSSTTTNVGGLVGLLTSGAEIQSETSAPVPSVLQVVSSLGTPGAGLWAASATCNAGFPYLTALEDTFPSKCRQQIGVPPSRGSTRAPKAPLNHFLVVRSPEKKLPAISFLSSRQTDQIKKKFVVNLNEQAKSNLTIMAREKFSLVLSHNSIKPVSVWLESKDSKLNKVGILDFSTSQEISLPAVKFNKSGSYRLIFSTDGIDSELGTSTSAQQPVGVLDFFVTPRFEKKCVMDACTRSRI